MILAYDPDKATQLRLRVERTVGQLNFKDFAATTQLEAGTVNAGNPNLAPERAWVVEAAVERRFWKSGAVVLTVNHAEVQAVVDLIPIAGRFDAPGNIGSGRREEARLSLTLPLDRVGVTGGLIRFNGTWRRSSVTDPVTGAARRISNQRPFEGDVYLGKTFPKLNSTLALEGNFGFTETAYRINEVRKTVERPLWKIYWDWSPDPSLIFRFQAENITAKTRSRERDLYTGPRSANAINFVERRTQTLAPFLMFRVRKTFS
jgi:outer membrane receptor protein involved in Fe transport